MIFSISCNWTKDNLTSWEAQAAVNYQQAASEPFEVEITHTIRSSQLADAASGLTCSVSPPGGLPQALNFTGKGRAGIQTLRGKPAGKGRVKQLKVEGIPAPLE